MLRMHICLDTSPSNKKKLMLMLMAQQVLQVCAAASNSEQLACTISPALSILELILIVMGGALVSVYGGTGVAKGAGGEPGLSRC
jgi:hypothetical protein